MALGGSGGGGSGGIRAGAAFVELFTKDAKLRSGLASAANVLRTFAAGMATIGAGLVGVGVTAGAALASVFTAANNRSTEFYRLSQRLGESTEKLSAFAYAAETTGQSLRDLDGHNENLAERIEQARSGVGEAAEAFRKINLDPTTMMLAGNTEQWLLLADAMRPFTNDTFRRAILSSLGGDKLQGMNELLKMGRSGILEVMAQAGQVGAIVTTDNARAAAEVSGAWSKAYAAIKYSLLSVGDVVLGNAAADKALAGMATQAAIRAREWIAANRELVTVLGASAAGAVALGAALVAASVPFRVLASSIAPIYTVLSTIVRGVLSPAVAGFAALRATAGLAGTALTATWSAVGATASAGLTVLTSSAAAAVAITRALAGVTLSLSGAYGAASAVLSAAAALVGGALTAAYGAARAAAVAAYTATTMANVKWAAQAAVVAACQAACGAFSVALLGVQAAQRAFTAAMLAAEATVMAAAGALAAAPAAIGAAWAAMKAATTAALLGVEAAVMAVSAVITATFTTTAGLQAAWTAATWAMSAAWTAFSALYTTTGAVVTALPAVFGAVWAGGCAAASAAWAGFTALWSVGVGIVTAGVAIMKAAVLALPLAIAGLAVYWVAFSDSGKQATSDLADSITQWFGEAFDNVKEAYGGIASAIKRGDLELAFSIGLATLKTEWSRALVYLTEAWNKFKKLFVDGWRDVALKFTNIWASAVHGTAGVLTDLGEMTGIYSEKEAADIRKIMADDAIAEKKARIAASIKAQAAADEARAADERATKEQLAAAEKEQKHLLLVNKMRENFALLKGDKSEKDKAGAGGKNGNDILGGLAAVRSTYGGSASLGFFGGAAAPFKKLEDRAAQTNVLLGKILAALDNRPPALGPGPAGEMTFT